MVQGAPGVWDLHCNFEASGTGIGPFPDLVRVILLLVTLLVILLVTLLMTLLV